MRLFDLNQPPQKPLHMEVDGWATWELIDARSGLILRTGEQHNLLLNQGLDLMATYGLGATNNENSGIAQFLVVGTGTAEPVATQTAMGAELARTNYVPPGYGYSVTRVAPGVYRRTITREFTEAQANGNLGEWGFSPVPGANQALGVRERFRDAGGNGIILTKINTQRLRVTYTQEFRFGPLVNTPAAFNIAGIGDVSGSYSLNYRSQVYTAGWPAVENCDYLLMDAMLRGAGNVFILTGRGSTPPTYNNFGGHLGTIPHVNTLSTTLTGPAYVPGSFQRALNAVFSVSQGNQTHYGWALGSELTNINSTNYYYSGYTYLLDAGKEITTKNDLKTLTISGFGATWGRA